MNKTRHTIILATLILAALVLNACSIGDGTTVRGSGNVVTQEEAISDFDRLDVAQGFQVNVSQADAFSVVIRVDDNLVEDVQVVKEDSTLKIGLKPGRSYNLENVTLEADVTMPELAGIDLNTGSLANIKDFKSAMALDADLSTGSHLEGDVEAGDTTINLSEGSQVTLSGSAGDLAIDARGGSHAKLADLKVDNANVEASGGSHATVNPSGTLDAVAKGGSHVKYLGSPTMGTIDDDGSSSIQQE